MSNYVKRLFAFGVSCIALFCLSLIALNQTEKNTLWIGSKVETENVILAEILSILIEKKTHLKVRHLKELEGTIVCFNALCSKDLDLYVEYTGTALCAILKEDLNHTFDFTRKELQKRYHLAWLEPLGFSNNYALFTKKPDLQKFSQLTGLRIGVDPEFAARYEASALASAYNVSFEIMDQGLLFLSDHDVVVAGATDARTRGFSRLEDEDALFPIYEPVPLVRCEVLQKYPELKSILLSCKNLITCEEMMQLNIEVDLNHKNPYDVALGYLKSKGLF